MVSYLTYHIRELEESHLKPGIRGNKEEMDRILADEYREIGSSGRMYDQADCLSGNLSQDNLSLEQYEWQLLAPDVVLTTYLLRNKTLNRHTLRSSIWKQIEGRWQLFFHQGTVSSNVSDGESSIKVN